MTLGVCIIWLLGKTSRKRNFEFHPLRHVRAPRSYPGRFEPLQKLAAGYTRLALNWPAAWLRVVILYLYIFHVLFSYLYKPGTSFNPPPPLHEVQVGEAGFSDGDILMFVCLFGLSSIA